MNDRRSSSDLGSSAEATLAAFPFPERDWERDARAIEARLSSSLRGSTDASLLAAPLPSEADEPSMASATATPLTNSGVRTQSLAELARRSVEKKQATERQMARESLALAALAAQQRPRPAASEATPLPANAAGPAASGPITGSVVASNTALPNVAAAANKPFPKVALVFPALALAAAAVLWFRHPDPAPLAGNEPAAAPPSATPASAAAPSVSTLAHNRPTPAEEVPRGIDPSTLPDQGAAPDSSTRATATAAAAPAKAAVSKTAKSDRGASVASDPGGLPPDPTLRPADSRGGELPAKPTTGAVQAALGAVMSGARHCVAGDDSASRAVVVFGSDGRVQQVTVSGAAAGKSSASCIEAQLSRARVQPFAASSFSVNATVRPE